VIAGVSKYRPMADGAITCTPRFSRISAVSRERH
jgi:hypothetical protein